VENFQDLNLTGAALVESRGTDTGDIEIQARNISLLEGSEIDISTSEGKAGNLRVVATDSLDSFLLLLKEKLMGAISIFPFPLSPFPKQNQGVSHKYEKRYKTAISLNLSSQNNTLSFWSQNQTLLLELNEGFSDGNSRGADGIG
jgi:hypothetical protein